MVSLPWACHLEPARLTRMVTSAVCVNIRSACSAIADHTLQSQEARLVPSRSHTLRLRLLLVSPDAALSTPPQSHYHLAIHGNITRTFAILTTFNMIAMAKYHLIRSQITRQHPASLHWSFVCEFLFSTTEASRTPVSYHHPSTPR